MNITLNDLRSIMPAHALIIGAFVVVAAGTLVRAEKRQGISEFLCYVSLAFALATVFFRLLPPKGQDHIAPLTGFNGSVTLSLTGQPSGATVTFTPNPATGTSTLTVATLSTTSRRTYTLTIGGVSGSLSHTITASLTVTK